MVNSHPFLREDAWSFFFKKPLITAAMKSMNMGPEPNQHRIGINNRRCNNKPPG
jgi:hypothetical protein